MMQNVPGAPANPCHVEPETTDHFRMADNPSGCFTIRRISLPTIDELQGTFDSSVDLPGHWPMAPW
jgi:hypothetical protein